MQSVQEVGGAVAVTGSLTVPTADDSSITIVVTRNSDRIQACDSVLYKLFLDKWDGQTSVVPALPGTAGGSGNSVIVNGRR